MSLHIKTISAKNFKNLQLKSLQFKPITLIMGGNGIGKSNLLQLLHALVRSKETVEDVEGTQYALDGRLPDEDLVLRGEMRGEASIVFGMGYEDFHDLRLAFDGVLENPDQKEISFDFDFWKDNGTVFKISRIYIGGTLIYSAAADGPQPEEAALPVLHAWIEEHILDSILYIPTNRVLHRKMVPYEADSDVDAVDNLENTILRLLSSKHEDDTVADRIRETLGKFFDIQDFRSELQPISQPMDDGVNESEKSFRSHLGRPMSDLRVGIRIREKDKQWFDLHQVGTGIQQLLVIIAMIHQQKARIALVEEFDSSLSPANRKALLDHLTNLTGRSKPLAQVITTTHGAFRLMDKRPQAICPTVPKKGMVGFKPADKKFWADYLLQADA